MLLDTSGLLCCLDSSEERHATAIELYEAESQRITHNYVFAELIALAQVRGVARQETIQLVITLASDSDVEVVWVDRLLHEEALKMLLAQTDKSYSLCDAVSMTLMAKRGISEALTTDRHFDQAGYRRLLSD